MSKQPAEWHPRRKRRTREHILEDLSQNHLERYVLQQGHILRRPERDYGVDVTMFHFDANGEIENGEVRFQLKATDNLRTVHNGAFITYPIKTGDLYHWSLETYPFILLVFDATTSSAFWLDVQDYVRKNAELGASESESVNVHIPIDNRLNLESVDLFRRQSLETIERIRNQGGL